MPEFTVAGFRLRPQHGVLIALGGIAVLLHLAGWQDALAYQRDLLEQGEFWRLWTGNLVHVDTVHLLLNLGGLFVVGLFCGRRPSVAGLIVALLVLMPVVSLGLYLKDPRVGWYMGLSGVLHGLLILFLARDLQFHPRLDGVLLVVLFAKLAWEWRYGSLTGKALFDFPVVTSAHVYGALGGALLALWFEIADLLRGKEASQATTGKDPDAS
ncbi:MAG: rhombosortase [Gammaproteobacteria bacterium]|nr:MAG: rhombosortase [Gammaproteobacteria bacterium]